MLQHQPVSLADIAAELDRLCQAGRSGVLRIVTDKNHAASFGLVAGHIVNIRYRIKRNLDALPLLKQIETGQYSFSEGESTGDERAALPPNEAVFEQLGYYSAPVSGAGSVPVSTLEPAPSVPSPAKAAVISPGERVVLEAALAEHIGPMASIVCRNTFAQASSLSEAISALASKIPNAERAQRFEREVRGRLV